jgi:hypothetical protein
MEALRLDKTIYLHHLHNAYFAWRFLFSFQRTATLACLARYAFLLLSQPGIIVYHKLVAMSIALFLETRRYWPTNTAPHRATFS